MAVATSGMNEADKQFERYLRVAPLITVIGILIGFLFAGGKAVAIPFVIALGLLIGWLQVKGVRVIRDKF